MLLALCERRAEGMQSARRRQLALGASTSREHLHELKKRRCDVASSLQAAIATRQPSSLATIQW